MPTVAHANRWRHDASPSLLRSAAPPASPATAPTPPAPVVDALIAAGGPAVLIFETLAERTLALAQLRAPRRSRRRLRAAARRRCCGRCWRAASAHGIRIVSNFGAANPRGAARRIARWRASSGLRAPRIAVVEGDDLSRRRSTAPLLRERSARRMRRHATSSAPTPTSAPSRSPTRCAPAPRSSSAAASPTRRSPSARRSRTSAGRATTGTASAARDDGRPPARMRRAGQRRLLRRPGLQGRARPGARSAIPIAEIDADGDCVDHQARRHRRPRRRAHGEGAAALRGARPGAPT